MKAAKSFVLGSVLMLAGLPAAAQEEESQQKPDPEGQSEVDVLSLPPSAWAVGRRPDAVERAFNKSRKKVWKALIKTLDQMKIPVNDASEEAGLINTTLANFGQDSGWGNVATKPPDLSQERPITQRAGLRRGKFSLRIKVTEDEGSTRVVVSAYLEEEARYAPLDEKIWVERYSNGHLEQLVLERVGASIE